MIKIAVYGFFLVPLFTFRPFLIYSSSLNSYFEFLVNQIAKMFTLFRSSLAKISPICSSINARRSCALQLSRNAPNLPPSPVHWTRTRLRRRAWMVNSESLLQHTHKKTRFFQTKKMVFILTAVSLPFTVIHQNNNQKCTKRV